MTTRASHEGGARAALALAFAVGLSFVGCDQHGSTGPVTSARPLVAAASAAPSALPSAKPAARCVTPEGVGVVALSALKGESASEIAAVGAARRELKRVLEVPDEYFGNVQSAGDLVLLELWPRSAFLPENCEKAANRCAKCRTLAYDPKLGRIVSTKVWEQADDDARPEPGRR